MKYTNDHIIHQNKMINLVCHNQMLSQICMYNMCCTSILITCCYYQHDIMFDLTLCLCVVAAVWSWTSSSRRTSCSRWWWGFALRRTATSPLCLTPRRPSPPPLNASPKLTPRSTLAGNFGSCKNTGPSPPPLLMHGIYESVYSSIFVWFNHRLQFFLSNLFWYTWC